MSDFSKKIFMQMGFLPTEWEEFFSSLGFTISRDDGDAKWCLVDDATSPDLWAPTYKIIHFGEKVPQNRLPIISMNPKWLAHPIVKQLLIQSLVDDQSIKIDELIGDSIPEMKAFKFGGHHRLGMYIDSMGIEAISRDFDVLKIKAATLFLGHYLSYLRDENYIKGLCEVQYGVAEDCFILSMDVMAENFDQAYIEACMGDHNGPLTSKTLLRWVLQSTNFLDICFLKDDGKLRLTLIWNNNENDKGSGLLLTRIPHAGFGKKSSTRLLNPAMIKEEDESKRLSNNPFLSSEQNNEIDDLEVKKAALFVLGTSSLTEGEVSLEAIKSTLSQSDLFAGQEGLAEDVFNALKNKDVFNKISEELEEAAHKVDWQHASTDGLKKNLDTALTDIDSQRLFQNIFNQDKVTVSGLSEEEDGFVSKHQVVEKFKEKITAISGEIDSETMIKIQGLVEEKLNSYAIEKGFDPDKFSREDWVRFRNENLETISSELSSKLNINGLSADGSNHFGASAMFDSAETSHMFMEELGDHFFSLDNFSDEDKENLMVKSLDVVNRELGVFANKIGLYPEDLNARQLNDFKRIVFPQIKQVVFNGEIPSAIEEYFFKRDEEKSLSEEIKNKFKDKISEKKIAGDSSVFSELNSDTSKEVLFESVKEVLVEKFDFLNIDNEKKNEIREQVIQDLSTTMNLDQSQSMKVIDDCLQSIEKWKNEKIIEQASENALPQNQSTDPELEQKYRDLIEENEFLKSKLVSVEHDLNDYQQTDKKRNEQLSINIGELEELSKTTKIPPSAINEKSRAHLLNLLKNKDFPTSFDSKLLAIAVAKEEKLTNIAQALEKQVTVVQLEAKRKEMALTNELDQLRKEASIQKGELINLRQTGGAGASEKNIQLKNFEQKSKSDDLEKKRMAQEVENLKRIVETYKRKLNMAAENITAQASSVAGSNQSVNKLAQSYKALEGVKNSLQNKLELMIKDVEGAKGKLVKTSSELDVARKNNTILEKQVDALKNEVQMYKKKSETSSTAQMSQVEGKLKIEIQDLTKKLKDYELKYKAIETKLKNSAVTAQKVEKAVSPTDQKKIDQLAEGSKKLMKDLEAAKNQSAEDKKQLAKFKAESTKLQNEVNSLKKELDKLKGKAA